MARKIPYLKSTRLLLICQFKRIINATVDKGLAALQQRIQE